MKAGYPALGRAPDEQERRLVRDNPTQAKRRLEWGTQSLAGNPASLGMTKGKATLPWRAVAAKALAKSGLDTMLGIRTMIRAMENRDAA